MDSLDVYSEKRKEKDTRNEKILKFLSCFVNQYVIYSEKQKEIKYPLSAVPNGGDNF
jgi:hypothetical protein